MTVAMLTAAVHLRAMSQGDIAAAARLSATFKWPHRPEDWRMMLDLGHGIAAQMTNGDLVGTALWWPCGTAAATLGMVLVDPGAQRRGLGRAMMDAILDEMRGRALMLTATVAGRPLYDALGFTPFGAVAQHQGDVRGAVASKRVRAAETGDHPAILALDAAAFGFERRLLIERLLAVGTANVLDDGRGVTGFAMRRAFGRGSLVGPVVAASRTDALELIGASLTTGFTRIDTTDLSAEVEAGLGALGLPRSSTALPMVRDGWPMPKKGELRFALASQAYG